ncbi:MAG: hypothetical protein KDK02_12630 [Rhodobacteraceae bacterium]|nr:hypothetical protein [Paracoccaceae bacterium]
MTLRALGLAALLLAPVPAPAWWAWNRHEVLPLGGGIYEVIGEPGSGAQDFWCAIGDYGIARLGLPAVQRIYTWRGIGPSAARPGRKAMQFALAPPEGADTSTPLTLSLTRVGDNLTAAAARQYCYGNADPWERWWN